MQPYIGGSREALNGRSVEFGVQFDRMHLIEIVPDGFYHVA
jgi:hypothetical protein